MKKKSIMIICGIILIFLFSFVGYKIIKQNQLNEEITKIDKVLENYFNNYLKCDNQETIEQYKSMIKHYNLRVIRYNRARDTQYKLLNEQQELKRLEQFCKK